MHVIYMYANRSPVPRIAHGCLVRPACNTARTRPPPPVFPQLRRHVRRHPKRQGDTRIRPTHSPRSKADGFRNLSFCTEKPVTPNGVTGPDLRKLVAGVVFEPT